MKTEIYDTDREFLREIVLKKWKDVKNIPELRSLLKENVNKIRTVSYEKVN